MILSPTLCPWIPFRFKNKNLEIPSTLAFSKNRPTENMILSYSFPNLLFIIFFFGEAVLITTCSLIVSK